MDKVVNTTWAYDKAKEAAQSASVDWERQYFTTPDFARLFRIAWQDGYKQALLDRATEAKPTLTQGCSAAITHGFPVEKIS